MSARTHAFERRLRAETLSLASIRALIIINPVHEHKSLQNLRYVF